MFIYVISKSIHFAISKWVLCLSKRVPGDRIVILLEVCCNSSAKIDADLKWISPLKHLLMLFHNKTNLVCIDAIQLLRQILVPVGNSSSLAILSTLIREVYSHVHYDVLKLFEEGR